MVAAINRGQDYMKASNNVALVPTNGTFEFANTLSMAYRCVRSTIPTGRHLNIHPLPTDLCPMVISDSHWLLENLLCLTSNAIKYSDSDDIDLFVTLEPLKPTCPTTTTTTIHKVHDKHIIVTVEDHGVGVPEEMRETLFQPFRQAQRMTGGTGLGLYSLFKRVVALGGDCGVKARRDGTPGSSFWFSFPYRPDTTAIVPSTTNGDLLCMNLSTRGQDSTIVDSPLPGRNGKTPTGTSTRIDSMPLVASTLTNVATDRDIVVTFRNTVELPPLSTANVAVCESERSHSPLSVSQRHEHNDGALRVLLTDDAPTILKVCKRMLQTNGHAVQTAVNGNQSLEKLKTYYTNNECDVLLTDLQMPVMDGIECTKRFRAWEETQQCLSEEQGLPRRPRFLIVGMSANSDAQSKQEALDAGLDYFCRKPFNYDEFASIISTHNTRFVITTSQQPLPSRDAN